MPTFLHVDEYVPADPEHPCQGASPDLKLVTQPPTQLPVALASFASCAVGEIGDADGVGVVGVGVVGDVRGDTVLRATARCFGFCGLSTCFGASTTMLGSEVVAPPERVAVCDIAVPLRPHRSSAIDKIATASLATKSDENLIAISSQMRGQLIPSWNAGYQVAENGQVVSSDEHPHWAYGSPPIILVHRSRSVEMPAI